ncbi:MAG: LuxR C-terminal-related transcriptional regulator [Cyanobacteria bacterium P01_H01_bin.21]
MVAGILLLETKLYTPQPRPGLVSRPRLLDYLNRALERKLTLVSAPAGFGKTTLLAAWLAATPVSHAWVSLDQSDNDPTFFWSYVITALQKMRSGQSKLGEQALGLLQSSQPPAIETVLSILINEISAVENDFVLVLDDYHFIESQAIHGAIAFLLDHLPPQMHLVMASRSDPPLPLARLRVRRELIELRPADLRFTTDEAMTFLNQVMGLDLAAADVATLERRTEGWIAGLQLAALSMQGQANVSRFIAAFSGDDCYVIDYLLEEVLQRQPDDRRDFLLQTAVLKRLNGSLCNAVTEQTQGQKKLEMLERSNLFVVSLDNQRRWYRYHHLFADVLQTYLQAENPDLVSTLHRRASEWYEQNNLPADAIYHRLAAEDFEQAAALIERIWPIMRSSCQEATVRAWIRSLPPDFLQVRPVLSVVHAWVLLSADQLDAVETCLQAAEHWLVDATNKTKAGPVVVDAAQFKALPASIANARAYRAQALGDIASTVAYAQQALALLPDDADYERGTTSALLGLAHWAKGDLEAAYQAFTDGMANIYQGGGIVVVIGASFIRVTLRVFQGRLQDAIRIYKESLQLATQEGYRLSELNLGLSELHHEQGNWDAARELMQKSERLSKDTSLLGFEHLRYAAKARMRQTEGDMQGAIALMEQAEQCYYRSPLPDALPLAALKARMWVAAGQLAAALNWVQQQGLSVEDDLSYLREYEHITLAKILVAQYQRDGTEQIIQDAIVLLNRLLTAAESGDRGWSVLEILITLAMAHKAHRDVKSAIASLKRALTLAEPEGYIRVFMTEGKPMQELLRQVAVENVSAYVQQLLSAFEGGTSSSVAAATTELIEPLTPRESEILRLVAVGMRNQEIADQLVISLATVKRHVANVYGKLGVNSRTEAVAEANRLNLL